MKSVLMPSGLCLSTYNIEIRRTLWSIEVVTLEVGQCDDLCNQTINETLSVTTKELQSKKTHIVDQQK